MPYVAWLILFLHMPVKSVIIHCYSADLTDKASVDPRIRTGLENLVSQWILIPLKTNLWSAMDTISRYGSLILAGWNFRICEY